VVTLTVQPVNDAPVAQPDSYAVTEDGTLGIALPGVLDNDSDIDGDTLTATVVSGPAHGTLNFNPDGSFTYKPATNYNGPDNFTYRPSDGNALGVTVTVTFNVAAVKDSPASLPDSYVVNEDGILSVSVGGVLANDTDIDGNTLTASRISGPAHGTLVFNFDGT